MSSKFASAMVTFVLETHGSPTNNINARHTNRGVNLNVMVAEVGARASRSRYWEQMAQKRHEGLPDRIVVDVNFKRTCKAKRTVF